MNSTSLDVVVYQRHSSRARINHFCILQQCKSPEDYAERMCVVSQYHCRDIHSWDEGSCGFHPQRSCSCNQRDEDQEQSCEGKVYHTKVPITLDYHWMAYRLECEKGLRIQSLSFTLNLEEGIHIYVKHISQYFLSLGQRIIFCRGTYYMMTYFFLT